MRQGPWRQLLQQTPSSPKPHCGCISSYRSQAVSIFLAAAVSMQSFAPASHVRSGVPLSLVAIG